MASPLLIIPLSLALLVVLVRKSASGYELALPGCPQTCGNMSIPYPFGTKKGCYLNDDFFIKCNTTKGDPNPRGFLWGWDMNVTDINLSSGELRSWMGIARQCFSKNKHHSKTESYHDSGVDAGPFTISYTKNKFTVVGCDTSGYFSSYDSANDIVGCMSDCNRLEGVKNGSCAGSGCCQESVPKGTTLVDIILSSYNNYTNVSSFDSCGYAFVVEEAHYTFNSLDFTRLSSVDKQPVILDWTIEDQTCEDAVRDS